MKRIAWSSNLAYAIGLLTTDGNLSKDGRHFDFTSKDIEQLENFKNCLDLRVKIGWKVSGYSGKKYPRIQFGDVRLYRWLIGIGLKPNKSKTLGILRIPDRYFFDFLRGYFDGDGSIYGYWDKRWKSSFMFYLKFASASKEHLEWLNHMITRLLNIEGIINKGNRVYELIFAKKSSIQIINKMYKDRGAVFLTRKKIKIDKIINTEMAKLVDARG